MKIYLSGIGVTDACPEVVIGPKSRVMYSFYRSWDKGKPTDRLASVIAAATTDAKCVEVTRDDGRQWVVHRPQSHFFDSGAFSLWRKEGADYGFYRTNRFREYMDAYIAFIIKHQDVMDHVANMDVVPDHPKNANLAAKLSYRNFKYLRKNGIDPVPVVHYGASMDWIRTYADDEGFEYIALGGLVGSITKPEAIQWVNKCFDISPDLSYHGFGLTNYGAILRFPWYSVDSAVWDRASSYGRVIVPRQTKGEFDFTRPPLIVMISLESPSIRDGSGAHFLAMSQLEQKLVCDWLDEVEVPLGKWEPGGEEIIEHGVATHHSHRRRANILYFDRVQAFLDARGFVPHKKLPTGFGLDS